MGEIKIGLSKRKTLLAFVGSVIFIWFGILFILYPQKYISLVFNSAKLVSITGFAAVTFFGLCIIYISYKAFDKKPGLIIDENGITDNSNFGSFGLIKWAEISGIRTQQVMSAKFILIDVYHAEKFIPNSKLKASLVKANLRMYGTPLSITSNSLKCNFDDLEKLLHEAFNSYKTKTS